MPAVSNATRKEGELMKLRPLTPETSAKLRRQELEAENHENQGQPINDVNGTSEMVDSFVETHVNTHPDGGATMSPAGAMPSGSQMEHWRTAMPNPDATRPETMPASATRGTLRASQTKPKSRPGVGRKSTNSSNPGGSVRVNSGTRVADRRHSAR